MANGELLTKEDFYLTQHGNCIDIDVELRGVRAMLRFDLEATDELIKGLQKIRRDQRKTDRENLTNLVRKAATDLAKKSKPKIVKGSDYRHGDIVRIKKYKESSANAYGRVDGYPTDDKVWVANLNMPFSGTICGFLKPDEIELHKRK